MCIGHVGTAVLRSAPHQRSHCIAMRLRSRASVGRVTRRLSMLAPHRHMLVSVYIGYAGTAARHSAPRRLPTASPCVSDYVHPLGWRSTAPLGASSASHRIALCRQLYAPGMSAHQHAARCLVGARIPSPCLGDRMHGGPCIVAASMRSWSVKRQIGSMIKPDRRL